MKLVFQYKVYNELDVPVGPFDLSAIFGPFDREASSVTVPSKEYVEFKGDNVTFHFEKIKENFYNRLVELAVPSHLVQMLRIEEKTEAKPRPPVVPPVSNMGLPTHGPVPDQPAGTLPSDAQS